MNGRDELKVLALADSIDHADHVEAEQGMEICRTCSHYPVTVVTWPCVYHEHAELIRALIN